MRTQIGFLSMSLFLCACGGSSTGNPTAFAAGYYSGTLVANQDDCGYAGGIGMPSEQSWLTLVSGESVLLTSQSDGTAYSGQVDGSMSFEVSRQSVDKNSLCPLVISIDVDVKGVYTAQALLSDVVTCPPSMGGTSCTTSWLGMMTRSITPTGCAGCPPAALPSHPGNP